MYIIVNFLVNNSVNWRPIPTRNLWNNCEPSNWSCTYRYVLPEAVLGR